MFASGKPTSPLQGSLRGQMLGLRFTEADFSAVLSAQANNCTPHPSLQKVPKDTEQSGVQAQQESPTRSGGPNAQQVSVHQSCERFFRCMVTIRLHGDNLRLSQQAGRRVTVSTTVTDRLQGQEHGCTHDCCHEASRLCPRHLPVWRSYWGRRPERDHTTQRSYGS